jgi:hypothetical protein
MPNIARIPVVWDGLTGMPGVSVFYSLAADSTAAVAALTAFFTSIRASFPSGLTWSIPSNGDTLEELTGALTGEWTGAAGSGVTSNGGATSYAAGAGFRVVWGTGGIGPHKRIKGSTFLVPLLGSLYDVNGTIAGGTVSTTQTAANTLVATNKLRIWHRPTPGGSNGLVYLITSASVPDKVSTLRSRRV